MNEDSRDNKVHVSYIPASFQLLTTMKHYCAKSSACCMSRNFLSAEKFGLGDQNLWRNGPLSSWTEFFENFGPSVENWSIPLLVLNALFRCCQAPCKVAKESSYSSAVKFRAPTQLLFKECRDIYIYMW